MLNINFTIYGRYYLNANIFFHRIQYATAVFVTLYFFDVAVTLALYSLFEVTLNSVAE